MSISMSALVSGAKELVMRLKEREKSVDQVVIQSNALAKKVDAIQQLENELLNINEKANHRSKVAVLSSIQKENKVIKLLQQENDELKESLQEYQSVLELIMTKYRQQMLQLILLKKQQETSEKYHYANLVKNLQDKTDRIAEMTEIMRRAVELDDKNASEYEEVIQSLLVENRGLKELLRIKSRYGVKEDPNLTNKTESGTQTDDNNDSIVTNNNKNNSSSATNSPIKNELSVNVDSCSDSFKNISISPLKVSPLAMSPVSAVAAATTTAALSSTDAEKELNTNSNTDSSPTSANKTADQ